MVGTAIIAVFLIAMLLSLDKPQRLIKIQIYLTIIIGFTIYNLGAPRFSLYLCDVINFVLVFHIFFRQKRVSLGRNKCTKKQPYFNFFVMLFFFIGTFSAIINYENIMNVLLYFWSIRNYFRFFLFFIACKKFLKFTELPKLFKTLKYLLLISTILAILQYYVWGYGYKSGDLIGGIFGTITGVNGSFVLFALGMCTYYIIGYLRKSASTFDMMLVIMCSLISAVLGEIKFFFFALLLTAGCAIAFSKLSYRTLLIMLCGGILVLFSIVYLQTTYKFTEKFFGLESILHYITGGGYSYSPDSINRVGGIRTINKLVFGGNNSLFGVGLGNADHSAYFSSPIYNQYGNTHYAWFLAVYLYLETGWIGLICYISIFLALIKDTFALKHTSDDVSKVSVIALALSSIVLIVYNASLRADVAYVYFFFLAIPYLSDCNKNSQLFRQKTQEHFSASLSINRSIYADIYRIQKRLSRGKR